MSDFASALGDPRPRSPSPGRGGRFDDGGRRSPSDRWSAGQGPPPRNRSPDFGRKRRRDDSPPSRDRYIPNYEREPYRSRERERRDHYHHHHNDNHHSSTSFRGHDRGNRHPQGPEIYDDVYRRSGGGHRDDGFGYSPERGISTGRGGSHHSRSHLTPPSELPYLVTFRYFADYIRSTSPHIADDKDKLAEQWKRYRQDHTRKQLVAFFEENKAKSWFREKYLPGPEFEEMRERLKKKGREGKVERFTERLLSGELDIVNFDYLPLSKKFPTSKSTEVTVDGNANGGPTVVTGAVTSTIVTCNDEARPSNEDAADEPTATSKLEAKAPDAAETKIEDTVLDAEGEDFDDEELGNTIAEAMAIGDALPSQLGSLIGESMKGRTGSDDIVILPPLENQLFIKSISPDISRAELEAHCQKAEGFEYLAISDPHTGKKLHRVGWVVFRPGTDMTSAEKTLGETKINNFTLHMMIAERPSLQKLRTCPGILNTPERISKDLVQIRKLAQQYENEYYGPESVGDELRGSVAIEAKIKSMRDDLARTNDAPTDLKEQTPERQTDTEHAEIDTKNQIQQNKVHQIDKKALDLYLFYLRTAFNACYYCVCVCDFQEELLRRCAKHVRKPAPNYLSEYTKTPTPSGHGRRNGHPQLSTQRANEISWTRTLDERLSLILTPTEVDPRDFGGERIDDEIRRLCQPQITDEGAGKFRCKNCSKLFKAMNFIEKHIMSKHGEVINQESVERIKYLNNYVLDPSHTTPQPPAVPEHINGRLNNGMSTLLNPSHGIMSSMGPPMGGGPPDFHSGGGYSGMMAHPMGGSGSVMLGGPYPAYPPPMYPQYPGAFGPMAGPAPMFANGPMMGGGGGPGANGPGAYGGGYYMNPIGSSGNYPSAYPQPPHHQVYSSLPPIPPMSQGRMSSNGNGSRRLGDRISRHFADDHVPSLPVHEPKRNRREPENSMISADPRSKTVLAYNDLDTPAGDEVVLNY